ncbi:UDP-4-amino-4,6-dideoxy-N-acetyl-beta-L-altrosamine transaminase [Massilia sp. Root351]|uniref:UDP-4-amino-4, 6-dideoxy-N-acetyl-beta-L-altrosamine transaminase n=1 Tax=Massilia sp. Root351 TaxID=1736522 RepID=UPI000708D59A|nr:UDP-4-amino-4,6-dideoxy-N-acetyl-beta-L-altrosamine transaminase [Massilia sp. Root351]KQV89850.1 UDP-4-amino-4,6-dideoxy-N-acetyl-beta-L-altrosamine transaminase [Massilia sp. Root351]
MIPYGRQSITEDDIAAVAAVLRSDWITQGPSITAFENALARYCGAAHGVAVANATAALHIACLALDVGPGDLVWTSPNTFLASANCALYCGAEADFVDIDPATYNMCPQALERKLVAARAAGRLPKVVIPVHFAGQSCDMAAIARLAREYGFKVVEDASHAVGADYLDGKVGSCQYSDLAVFSFHPVKILTTGEGGMVMARDAALAQRLQQLRSHGMVRDAALSEQHGAWYYEQHTLGYNYRITDIQAALGLSQLGRLDSFVARRRALAARYDALLAGLPLQCPRQSPDGRSAFHLYPVWIDEAAAGRSRRAVFDGLRAAGIGVNVHYIPVPNQPYYQARGFQPGQFPAAERYYAGAISLPMYYSLSDAEQDQVVAALRRVLA